MSTYCNKHCWTSGWASATNSAAVGDDYQSIYGFRGAAPDHLLSIPGRYPQAKVVVLESNYRSTPEIIELANRLVPGLGGRKKVLRPTIGSGPEPTVQSFQSNEVEAAFIARRIVRLHGQGVERREMAILYRVNYRSSDFEAALLAAGIPFQVRGGGLLKREAARQIFPRLGRRRLEFGVGAVVREEARRSGYLVNPPDEFGAADRTIQEDLAQFIALARDFDGESRTVADFVAYLRDRFESESQRDAVQLMTYHSAKGLEFEAVFLPWLEEGEIPDWRAAKAGAVHEERRLFYVGLTRAKRYLLMTRSSGKKPPSRFLDELESSGRVAKPRRGRRKSRRTRGSGSGRARPRPTRSDGIVARVGCSLEWGSYQGVVESMDEAGVWLRVGAAKIHVRFGRRVSAGRRSGPLQSPG